MIGWVADDGRRRGDGAPVLVAHSTPELARGHLEDTDAARPALVTELCALLDLDPPRHTEVHRWTFAKPTGSRERTFLLSDGLGCCGDAWSATAKVESAFVSGRSSVRRWSRNSLEGRGCSTPARADRPCRSPVPNVVSGPPSAPRGRKNRPTRLKQNTF